MESSLDNYKLSCELFGHNMDVRAICSGIDERENDETIISGSRDKTVKVWKRIGKEYCESITYQDHKNFVSCVCFLEDSQWLCSGSNDATICIYNRANPNSYLPILRLEGHESTVCSIAAGVEPHSLVSGSWDKTARVWLIDELGGYASVVLRGHEAAVWAVASMPNTKKYITGSADKNIFYWNAKGEKLKVLKGHTDCVRGIIALKDNTLISCANDASIRYWNEDGECIQEMLGHSNYIYSVAQNATLGENIFVSCGEDSTLRMWNVEKGMELGAPIVHPAQSIWCVTCLKNGDIVTGSSDGIIRVFTKEPSRFANEVLLAAFQAQVDTRKSQMNDTLGGIKKTDLPGPEALLKNGTKDGQTLMVRHPDGSVKCYNWESGKWNLIGDVTGASGGTQNSSGKTLFEGKEYDFVFSVDISDNAPPIKLPYNRGEDPWHAAQSFIHRNNLPQVYLDEVARFIIKNSNESQIVMESGSRGYQDPFTGGSRYVPGSNNTNVQTSDNLDPFTGASSYSTQALSEQSKVNVNCAKGSENVFPVNKYLTFDSCDPTKVLEKLKEFNFKLTDERIKVSKTTIDDVIALAGSSPPLHAEPIDALQNLLNWPSDILFPVLDIARLAVRDETVFSVLNSFGFFEKILPNLKSTAPNQLMTIRCLANMMVHESGRSEVLKRLTKIVEYINAIKSGSSNLQIAIATLYLNLTAAQIIGLANIDACRIIAEGIIELMKWSTDLEACYRSILAIGNLTATPYNQEISALVISVDYVMDKIRNLANTPQTGTYTKLNTAGNALLAAF